MLWTGWVESSGDALRTGLHPRTRGSISLKAPPGKRACKLWSSLRLHWHTQRDEERRCHRGVCAACSCRLSNAWEPYFIIFHYILNCQLPPEFCVFLNINKNIVLAPTLCLTEEEESYCVYICYLHNVDPGRENDNCVSRKLALTVAPCCAPLFAAFRRV